MATKKKIVLRETAPNQHVTVSIRKMDRDVWFEFRKLCFNYNIESNEMIEILIQDHKKYRKGHAESSKQSQ